MVKSDNPASQYSCDMSAEKEFGKISAEQLLTVINYLPILSKYEKTLHHEFKGFPARTAELAPEGFSWAGAYEITIEQHIELLVVLLGQEAAILDAYRSADPLAAMIDLVEASKKTEPVVNPALLRQSDVFTDLVSLLMGLLRTMECVAVYGWYIHELIAEARSDHPDRDKSLLCAIRIDPSVITGPTGARRLSTAIAMNDKPFIAGLRLAMQGKTGDQAAYLRKFRRAIKVLAGSDVLRGSAKALAEKLVSLGIYPDGPGAVKNAAELIRKTKKSHAI